MRHFGKVVIDGKTILRQGQEFPSGSKIEVLDDKSFVQLEFPDGSIVLMKKGVSNFRSNQRSMILNLIEGTLFSYVRNKQAKNKLIIKTPVASFGVRGTKYFVTHTKKQSYLCVCEGSVEAKNLTTGTKQIVEKGKDLNLDKNKDQAITIAQDDMMDMAKAGFVDMGFPVE